MTDIAQRFIQALPANSKVRTYGAGWAACCPAHDDSDPSLSITVAESGDLLLYCFAGCSYQEVMRSVGLDQAAGFTKSLTRAGAIDYKRRAVLATKQNAEMIVKVAAGLTEQGQVLDDSQITELADAHHAIQQADAELGRLDGTTALELYNSYFQNQSNAHIVLPESILTTVIGQLAVRAAHTLEMPLGTVFLVLLGGAAAAAATNYCTEFASRTRIQLGLYVTAEQPPSVQKSHTLGVSINAGSNALGEHNQRLYRLNKDLGKQVLPYAFKPTSNATAAALDKELSKTDSGRFFISSSEQGAFNSLFPVSGTFATDNDLLLAGYVGERVNSMRANRDGLDGVAMGSVLLIAQKGSIQRVLNESNFTGLAERFLFASEPSLLGCRTLANGYLTDNDKSAFNRAAKGCVSRFSKRVTLTPEAQTALDARRTQLEQGATDDKGTKLADIAEPEIMVQTDLGDLTLIRPSEAGYRMILAKRQENEPLLGQLNSDGELTYCGWLGKLETHVLKIAAVLCIFDALADELDPPQVMADMYVGMAIQFVMAMGEHMRKIIRDSGEAGDPAEVDAVLRLLDQRRVTATTAAQTLRDRTPFRNCENRYMAAKARVAQMIDVGMIASDKDGYLRPC